MISAIMKKFLSIILSVSLAAGTVFAFASCGAYGFGADRSVVTPKSIYVKQSDSDHYDDFLIKTSYGDWLNYKTDGTYSFIGEEPDTADYSATDAAFDYTGKIAAFSTLEWGYYSCGPEYKFLINYFIENYVEEDLGFEVVAANVAIVNEFFYLNVYSSSNGDLLYKENIVASYVGFANHNGEEITAYEKYTDGRVYLFYDNIYSVYERDNIIYTCRDGAETALFEDDMNDRILQHDNALNVYYTGSYMYFERVRECIGYSLVTYTIAHLDGDHTVDICTVKRK